MAAGMIYTIGGSFWEFGGPDLERSKLFVMIGTAEDHHSNPLKIAISKFKRNGGRFISINPVRTGYSAIADEWIPIKPGTDGALFLALIHEIINQGLYDRDFLVRYTNSAQLVNVKGDSTEFGMFVRAEVPVEEGCFDPQNKLWWDRHTDKAVVTHAEGADPFLLGEFVLSDGTHVKPAFQLLVDRIKGLHPGVGQQHHRYPGQDHQAPGARDGHHRARPEDRVADLLDRHLGKGPRVRGRQPGVVPRHARAGRALQRLPHHPLAVDIDVDPRHHRPPGRVPPQGAVSRARSRPAPRPRAAPRACSPTSRSTAWHSAGRPTRTTCSSTRTARRCASTRASAGSTRCRCTG